MTPQRCETVFRIEEWPYSQRCKRRQKNLTLCNIEGETLSLCDRCYEKADEALYYKEAIAKSTHVGDKGENQNDTQ